MGALTSKPFAFVARSWELKSVESIDVFDSYLSSVRYDYRGSSILRVLPALNESLNQDWISDKVRFFYDAIYHQRIITPWVRFSLVYAHVCQNFGVRLGFNPNYGNDLFPVSWAYSLEVFHSVLVWLTSRLGLEKFMIYGLASPTTDFETLFRFKGLVNSFGSSQVNSGSNFQSVASLNQDFRCNYIFRFGDLEASEACFLIGCNPRYESPILNVRLREAVSNGRLRVYSVGANFTSNYGITNLGSNISTVISGISGRGAISKILLKFNRSLVLLGSSFLQVPISLSEFVCNKAGSLSLNYGKSIQIAHLVPFASSVGAAELGYDSKLHSLTAKPSSVNLFYLLGNDNLDLGSFNLRALDRNLVEINSESDINFSLYQGSHGDSNALLSHLIFPSALHTERNGFYLNLDGRLKLSRMVMAPNFPFIRTDQAIFKIINSTLKSVVSFSNLNQSISFVVSGLLSGKISFPGLDLSSGLISHDEVDFVPSSFAEISLLNKYNLQSFINEFFLTDSITRSSQNLTLASGLKQVRSTNFN